jgi:hypothetical protein
MVVDQKGFWAAPGSLGEYYWGSTGGDNLSGKSALAQHTGNQLSAFSQAPVLGSNAGLGYQSSQLGDAFIQVLFQVSVMFSEIGHFCPFMV